MTTPRNSRASFAYDRVRRWPKEWSQDATTRAKGLPVEVRTQGLWQTVAVLIHQSKKNLHAGALAELLAEWILRESPQHPFDLEVEADIRPQDLLRLCVEADRASYQAAQTEALCLLQEVKLLAQAWHAESE